MYLMILSPKLAQIYIKRLEEAASYFKDLGSLFQVKPPLMFGEKEPPTCPVSITVARFSTYSTLGCKDGPSWVFMLDLQNN